MAVQEVEALSRIQEPLFRTFLPRGRRTREESGWTKRLACHNVHTMILSSRKHSNTRSWSVVPVQRCLYRDLNLVLLVGVRVKSRCFFYNNKTQQV